MYVSCDMNMYIFLLCKCCHPTGTNQSSKYCLKTFVTSVKVSDISDGTYFDLWENATNIFYIKGKLSISIQKFEVSEISGGTYCNSKVNSETETYTVNFFMVAKL